MKTLFLFFLSALISGLVCIHSVTFGQSLPAGGGKISGLVADSLNKKPLDYVTINLMTGSTAVKADFTKSDGSFTFQKLKPAKYSKKTG